MQERRLTLPSEVLGRHKSRGTREKPLQAKSGREGGGGEDGCLACVAGKARKRAQEREGERVGE